MWEYQWGISKCKHASPLGTADTAKGKRKNSKAKVFISSIPGLRGARKISRPQQHTSLRGLVRSTGTFTASSSSSLTGLAQQAHTSAALPSTCSWVLGQGLLGLGSWPRLGLWALPQTHVAIPLALQKGKMGGG